MFSYVERRHLQHLESIMRYFFVFYISIFSTREFHEPEWRRLLLVLKACGVEKQET